MFTKFLVFDKLLEVSEPVMCFEIGSWFEQLVYIRGVVSKLRGKTSYQPWNHVNECQAVSDEQNSRRFRRTSLAQVDSESRFNQQKIWNLICELSPI